MIATRTLLHDVFKDRGSTEEESVTHCTTMLHDGWEQTEGEGGGRERERGKEGGEGDMGERVGGKEGERGRGGEQAEVTLGCATLHL